MLNNAYNLESWNFSDHDRILPDANFWINVFGPAPAVGQISWKTRVYSRALGQMLARKVSLYTDVTIMREFVNTLARLETARNYC